MVQSENNWFKICWKNHFSYCYKLCSEILLLHQCTFSFHCFTQNDRLSYTFLWGLRLINIGINDLRTFNQSHRDHEYINITAIYTYRERNYSGENIIFLLNCWTISAPGLSLCWTVEGGHTSFPNKNRPTNFFKLATTDWY